MIDYLYNPDFWTWRWGLRDIALKFWLLPLLAVIVTGNFKRGDHQRIIMFVAFTLLMDHVSSDDDLEFLFSDKTNAPWYHLLIPILFFLMTRFFTGYLDTSKYHWLKLWLPVGFTLLVILNALWGDGFYTFPGNVVGVYSIMGMLLVIWYFATLLGSLKISYLERYPMFWIGSGLLIYLASNFLLWVGMDFIAYNADFFNSIYRINGGATILLNLFFTIAICLNPKDETLKPTT